MVRHLCKKSVLFLSTIVLSGGVCSASIDKEALAFECKHLGTSLSQLAKTNLNEYCSVDVSYSGNMMKQSASLIQSNRITFAIENLDFVVRTLEHIRFNHQECPYFSSIVAPFTDKTKYLIRELDSHNHS